MSALDLFSEQGFAQVSMRGIADSVGIRVSSLYNHYKSKGDLLTAFYDYYADRFTKTTLTLDELRVRAKEIDAREALDLLNYDYGEQVAKTLTKIIRVATREARRDKQSEAFLEWYMNNCLKAPIELLINTLIEQKKIKPIDAKVISCIISNFAFSANFLSGSSVQMTHAEWNACIRFLFSIITG